MLNWNLFLFLAQGAGDAPAGQPAAPGLAATLIWILPVFIVFYILFVLPQNRERSARQEMLKSLKKNDSVITIGGIIGTVSHITEDGKEVTLKIDDNARIRMQREAIREIVRKESPGS